jgi:hypothetical protein
MHIHIHPYCGFPLLKLVRKLFSLFWKDSKNTTYTYLQHYRIQDKREDQYFSSTYFVPYRIMPMPNALENWASCV